MDYKESVQYINQLMGCADTDSVQRTRNMLDVLENPQKQLKFIHVTGTNGKGSACAMLASAMKACGYKTGLYTSPHLYRVNERLQINGHPIEDDVFADLMTKVRCAVEKQKETLSYFETLTICAMMWFAQENCEIVVLETGLGGTFDATNVIECPEAAVIMNIGLDHTGILGNTEENIADMKAGIVKPGCNCVSYEQSPAVRKILEEKCAEQRGTLTFADFDKIRIEFDTPEGQVFTYRDEPYAIALLGENQRKNAAVVLETLNVLRSKGWQLDQSDVEHGMYAAACPARFEVVSDEDVFVVDGGHNPQGVATTADNLENYFPDQPHVILIGVQADKDYRKMAEILAPTASEFVCAAPDSERALIAEELAKELEPYGKPVTVCDTIRNGVAAAQDIARECNGMVCAVGSLYMAAEVRSCFIN